MATAAKESSVGIFWGPAGRLPSADGSRHSQQSSTAARSVLHLPRLAQSPATKSASLLLPEDKAPSRDSAATSLLEVLQTLLRSIKGDMSNFTKSRRAMDPPADSTVHFVDQNGPRYYSPGVAGEDREFFIRERERDADREATLAATALARERHCAVLDKQFYTFDRRRSGRTSKVSRQSTEEAAAAADSDRIDRHRRKVEHLLHVLQDEIARETQREIEFLEFSGPHGPGSRQSRRRMALIIKNRYEAADRIMRILEEYKLVVGVPAADYLLKAIAEGNALA